MHHTIGFRLRASLTSSLFAMAAWCGAAGAQTTLTMSSWVPPSHALTKDVLTVWAQNVEKASNGRVKLQMLPKHPSAPPGTFDAVKDGLVDVSYVTAAARVARWRRHRRNQFGGLFADPLEALARHRRIQGRQAAGGLYARPRPNVQYQATDQQSRGSGGHENPLGRRHFRADGARAGRLSLRQARPGIL